MPVPLAIPIATSIIGGIFGKKGQKKQQDLARQQLQAQMEMSRQQSANQQRLMDMAAPFATGAQQAFKDVQGWWSPILAGNTSAINQFLSPERSAINQGYQSAVGNAARFGPRGGGQVSALAQGDLARQQQLSNLIFGARQNAAGALGNLGQAQGSLGQGLMGLGNQSAQMASLFSDRGYGAMADALKNPAGAQAMQSLGNILGQAMGGGQGGSGGEKMGFMKTMFGKGK